MKTTKFYPTIWQMVPYSLEMNPWGGRESSVKDLVLTNTYLYRTSVSAMFLTIKMLSVFDAKGKEYFIKDFPGGIGVPVNGMHRGEFLRSGNGLELKEGSYTAFRFYLGKAGNKFTYSDRREEPVWGREYLDFKVENRLVIKKGESPEVILRFDLAPFEPHIFFRWLAQLLKSPRKLTARVANSLGN